jgi:hypothetical protein
MVLRFAHGVAPLSVSSGMLKNYWHELQNQLPGFGPLAISLNLRHVAANRMVSPITPTCTDAPGGKSNRTVFFVKLLSIMSFPRMLFGRSYR